MKQTALIMAFVFLSVSLFAQSSPSPADSSDVKTLNEIVIKAYEQNRKLIDVAAPVAVTGQAQLNRFSNMSILPALNITPGVSMEERSPGSYRLNIRGSSLRSPFGVRDVKIYLNDVPLTDPSGNTYLNQLSFYNFQSTEIIKGPAGSLYGASIGGAALIHTMPDVWKNGTTLDYSVGSFTTNNFNANIRFGDGDHENVFNYSHQTSNGYRQQTKMHRDVLSWENALKMTDKQTLHAFLYYGDLYYQTPGALTKSQYDSSASQARPGAISAQAAIFQKTIITGFSNEYHFSDNWQNTTAVYGTYTDFINPGLRVYEIRKEPHFGGRSVFQYKTQIDETVLQVNFGGEAQKGFFNTRDYGNNLGIADSLETDDDINLWQYMIFAQADLKLNRGWIITVGGSLNKSSLEFVNLFTRPSSNATSQTRTFENKLPPHVGILKKITEAISIYANVARGFSTPTSAELLRSDGLLGRNLQPEDGMDYELGTRGSFLHDKLYFDISGFFFHLYNTIVQRIDTSGVYSYVNAGSTKQNGIESYISYELADNANLFINGAKIFVSYAWHDFHYGSFKQLTSDYSGNNMPGVAPNVVVSGFDINAKIGFYANLTYTYTDKIYMNDANTSSASSFNLFGARIGFRKMPTTKFKIEIFAGADNIFNARYSLGNDINAAAGRFYNAAALRNYFAGLIFQFF
ncbi:MAG TPA: TonB-dependent receptor [Puia sp.]|nr:TonB-dependent receptor [Puia sp.]